jgi:hypothetical protein
MLIATVFTILWSFVSVRFALTGRLMGGPATPSGMHLVFALDLSLMAPSLFLAGSLLWARKAWGFVLGTALCVFGAAYQVNLAFAGVAQWKAGVEGVKVVDPTGIAIILMFLVAAVLMLRNLRPNPMEVTR